MAERKGPKTKALKKPPLRGKPRNFDYPDQTDGSRLAARLRTDTNRLTVKERNELFQRGMQIIYGGAKAKEKSGVGH